MHVGHVFVTCTLNFFFFFSPFHFSLHNIDLLVFSFEECCLVKDFIAEELYTDRESIQTKEIIEKPDTFIFYF